MILELAYNISIIWPNQLQIRTQRNALTRVYTNKICSVINQWNWGWAEQHVSIALWSTCAALSREHPS